VFLGKLMGIALRTGSGLDLDLPSLVWRQLVADPVQWSDVAAIDSAVDERLRSVAAVVAQTLRPTAAAGEGGGGSGGGGGGGGEREDTEVISERMWAGVVREMSLFHTVTGVDGSSKEIVPGGRELTLLWADRRRYVRMAKQVRSISQRADVISQTPFLPSFLPSFLRTFSSLSVTCDLDCIDCH